MGKLFGVDKPKAPPPPPTRSDAEVRAAAEAERKRLRARAGRSSTILTGGQGVTDGVESKKKRLLGE